MVEKALLCSSLFNIYWIELPERGHEEMKVVMESHSYHSGFASDRDPISPTADECYQVLMDLVDKNISVLNGKDHSRLDESIRNKLNGKPLFLYITVRNCCLITQICKEYLLFSDK